VSHGAPEGRHFNLGSFELGAPDIARKKSMENDVNYAVIKSRKNLNFQKTHIAEDTTTTRNSLLIFFILHCYSLPAQFSTSRFFIECARSAFNKTSWTKKRKIKMH
jgi:hypothetical protein